MIIFYLNYTRFDVEALFSSAQFQSLVNANLTKLPEIVEI